MYIKFLVFLLSDFERIYVKFVLLVKKWGLSVYHNDTFPYNVCAEQLSVLDIERHHLIIFTIVIPGKCQVDLV